MDIEKRFQSMEASIKAIAEYVKEQTGKIEEEMAPLKEEPLADYKDDLDDLRRRIDSFAGEKEFSRLQFKKLDKLEQTLDERMGKIEELARSAHTDERTKKTLQTTRAEMDSLKRDIVSKMRFLDEKLGKIEEKSDVHELKKEFMEEMQKWEKELTEAKSYKKELQGLNNAMLDEFRSRIAASEKTMDDIAAKIENFKDASWKDDFEKFRNDLASRLQILDKSIKEIAGSTDTEELKERMEMIDNKLNESLVLKNHLDNMEKSLDEMRSIASRLKGFDAETYRKEFEKRMNDVLAQAHHLGAEDVKKINEMLAGLRDIEVDDIKKMNETLSKVKKMEGEDIEKIRNLSDAFDNLKSTETDDLSEFANQIKEAKEMFSQMKDLKVQDIRKLNEALEQLKESEIEDIKNFAKQLKEAKELLEDESISRISVEKRINGLEAGMEKFGKNMSYTLTQLKGLEEKDISKLNEMLTKFEQLEEHDVHKLAEQMKEARDTLEDESISRISYEKKLADMETKLNKMYDIVSHIENLEGLDIQKLGNRIQDIESSMKMNTVKLLTQQLNEFAKSVDRRLPNIVSREEYIREVADIKQRMRTIEAPDLSPLGARVERLEQKIEEVAAMMRSMYNRVPIVVE